MRSLLQMLLVGLALAGGAAGQGVKPANALTSEEQASRFLSQATFGPSPEGIAELRNLGYDYNRWIEAEAAKPSTYAAPLVVAARDAGLITTIDNTYNRRARNQVMIAGRDQLRQRVAYALSQIFVISDNTTAISNGREGSSSYYDMLVRDALGSFRTLLMDVTHHPMMGRYLSHYRNRKANTTTGTRPDENYAREVMQFFSIGLFHLNPDGTFRTDGTGRPLETYTNDNITEFARVFTGFTDENHNPSAVGTGTGRTDFPSATANYVEPMIMWEQQHDTGAKTLLSYPGARKVSLPAGQSGLQDVGDAIDNLVEHPNTGPFISRQLIQRLVTSNPSDGYVGRVAAVFANNGRGQRGDLLAVVKAILLDAEARSPSFIVDREHGKLREPFLRVTHLLRAFRYTVDQGDGLLPYDFTSAVNENSLGQYPLAAPSVFNFYLPDYQPAGPVEDAGLVGPEFQILNSVYAVTVPNIVYNLVHNSRVGRFGLTLDEQAALTDNPAVLVENLDLLLTGGTLSDTTRQTVISAVSGVTNAYVPSGSTLAMTRARLAVFLVAISPDYAILK